MIFAFFVSGIYTSNAATYTNVADTNHQGFVEPLINAVNNYLSSHGTITSTNIPAIAAIVQATILANGGWSGAMPASYTANNLVQLTGTTLTVGCWNEPLVSFNLPPPPPAPPTPPPPPAPVVTTSSSTSYGWSCSSYIGWAENWSACGINSDWTSVWTITCQQTNSWTPVSVSCGSTVSTTTTTCVDLSCSDSTSSYCDASSCSWNAPQPAAQTQVKTFTINLGSSMTNYNNAYANNSDTNIVSVNILGTTNQNREVTGWWGNGIFSNFIESSNIPSDRINGWWRALNFWSVPSVNINGAWTNWSFQIPGIKSISPFVWNGSLSFKSGTTPITLTSVSFHFKKPFIWNIQTSNDNGITWNGKPELWTELLYKLWLTQKSSLTWNGLSNYTLNNFTNEIQPYGAWLETQSESVVLATITSNSGTQFKARINSSTDASSLNQNPWLQVNLPIISYTLWWQTVRYKLSEQDSWADTTPIKTTIETKFLWVLIIWGIQWAGKSEFTWQKANISNIAPSEMRAKIRQNAYAYIKHMTNGQIVNGVKYVIWDTIVSGEPDYETLIVKDGNVIINGNLNASNKKLGIVVMKDGYNISTDYSGKWNIYITPSVTKINATIYADGWLISAGASWSPYVSDSSDRTYALKNQLVMNGSLFTRNTIGWATLAGWSYVLPGGSTLTNTDSNFDKAMIYDLNYIRRWSNLCDKNANGNCTDSWEYQEPFVIKYNPAVQTDPPKIFR